MKKIHCDICGKEIKIDDLTTKLWDSQVFIDLDENHIEDVCVDCFKIIHCCINMMKETGWRPDFHEVLKSDDPWKREIAGYKLYDLEKRTGLKF